MLADLVKPDADTVDQDDYPTRWQAGEHSLRLTYQFEPGTDADDGPPWTIHPMTRGGAERTFRHLAPGATIMLDDAARPGERLVARRWRKMHPEIDFHLWKGGEKGTLIGIKRA